MPNQIKVLLVDDHQVIIEGLITLLKHIESIEIETANSCDEAYYKIKSSIEQVPFDIIFTDLSFDIDPKDNVELLGGEDLIKKIKEENLAIKVGVITGHSEINRVYNVIENLKPSAYILKGKCSTSDLSFAIQKMLNGEVFYTHEIHQKLLKRVLVEIQMDDVALQILSEIPKHSKISNLEGIVKKEDGTYVKLRTIENKLARLRIDFNANNNTDLVLKAKEFGIID